MIKYKYLPFTRNKPRYQRVPEPAVATKWQLAAQTLPATTTTTLSDKKEEKLLDTKSSASTIATTISPTTAAASSLLSSSTAATSAVTNVAKPPQIIMIDEWMNKFLKQQQYMLFWNLFHFKH